MRFTVVHSVASGRPFAYSSRLFRASLRLLVREGVERFQKKTFYTFYSCGASRKQQ